MKAAMYFAYIAGTLVIIVGILFCFAGHPKYFLLNTPVGLLCWFMASLCKDTLKYKKQK